MRRKPRSESQVVVERCLRRIRENEEALQELEAEVGDREPTDQERRLWIAYKQGIEQSRLQIDAELRLISRDRPG
jgi:DNA-directed RNA polymerase specialized sigma subunit